MPNINPSIMLMQQMARMGESVANRTQRFNEMYERARQRQLDREFRAGESKLRRGFDADQSVMDREFRAGESVLSRGFTAEQNAMSRELEGERIDLSRASGERAQSAEERASELHGPALREAELGVERTERMNELLGGGARRESPDAFSEQSPENRSRIDGVYERFGSPSRMSREDVLEKQRNEDISKALLAGGHVSQSIAMDREASRRDSARASMAARRNIAKLVGTGMSEADALQATFSDPRFKDVERMERQEIRMMMGVGESTDVPSRQKYALEAALKAMDQNSPEVPGTPGYAEELKHMVRHFQGVYDDVVAGDAGGGAENRRSREDFPNKIGRFDIEIPEQ